MPLVAGSRLGPYEIVSALGAGGMGEVYRARDPRLGRDVAIKVLPESLATDPARLHRFEQEARAVAALSHPNVLAIFDIGTDQPPFIVTELLDGETLRARIDRGPIGSRQTIELALQLVAGLAAAHARGIVHRDLKPQNLFVTRDGVVKILDFGLAKAVAPTIDADGGAVLHADIDPTMTSAGIILGTVGYMAPEQVRGEAVDRRADLFAVGTILYEMAAGERAFRGDSPADTISAVLREQPPDLTVRTGTPPALARVIRRCLEKSVSERFQSARDLAFALESISDEHGARSAPASKKADTRSVAVLPFANMSADADNQYFSDGLAEELINALIRLPGLQVASRTSAFRFRGRDVDIRHIGRELQVATVLEGSVRRAGNRLRVTAQLTNIADGFHIWSERYDREMADVFAIQDEIVEAIVRAIAPAVAGDARAAVKRPTENVEAYEMYLKGRHYWHQRSPSAFTVARRHFEEVIALDPDYALAYAGLADCYSVGRVYGWYTAAQAREPARAAVARAMLLDPSLPDVHFSQGAYQFVLQPDWRSAMPHLRRAVEISPRLVDAHGYIAMVLACDSRPLQARAALEVTTRLDPLSPIAHFITAASLAMAGDDDGAERAARRVLELQPDSLMGHYAMCNAHLRRNVEQAVTEGERCIALSRAPFYIGHLGLAYGKAGRQDDARRLLTEVDSRASRGEYIPPMVRAMIAIGLGDSAGIVDALRACIDDETPAFDILFLGGGAIGALDDPATTSLIDRIVNPLFPAGESGRG